MMIVEAQKRAKRKYWEDRPADFQVLSWNYDWANGHNGRIHSHCEVK